MISVQIRSQQFPCLECFPLFEQHFTEFRHRIGPHLIFVYQRPEPLFATHLIAKSILTYCYNQVYSMNTYKVSGLRSKVRYPFLSKLLMKGVVYVPIAYTRLVNNLACAMLIRYSHVMTSSNTSYIVLYLDIIFKPVSKTFWKSSW